MKSLQLFSGLLLAASAATAQQYTVTTVAGYPKVQGYYGDGGTATAAELAMPTRVALDSKGNYYIADYLNHVVREVTPAGVISTLAGGVTLATGVGDNGPATQASLSDVHGIAVDSSGNVFIADTGNSRVRKVDSKGVITTFAGNGTFGYSGDGAAATSAQVARPAGLAIDSAGNLYIADYGNSTVRKVDSKGVITTVAGTGNFGFSGDGGAANKAVLSTPLALAFDPAGNLYISDTSNTDIREIGSDGNIRTVVSNIDAESIAVDAGSNIFYPNYLAQTVVKILPNGTQVAIAGTGSSGFSGDGGTANSAQFNFPYGLALDSAGHIYVADSLNQIVRLLTPVISTAGVVNAASGISGSIAPGEIVVLYGNGLGPATLTTSSPVNGFYPKQLAGTAVTFDGAPAPILYTWATQVAVVVPYAQAGGVNANITVSYQGNQSTSTAPVRRAAPGIFTINATGLGQAALVNQDGSINSISNPARIGSTVALYATGEGYEANPDAADGKISTPPFSSAFLPVQVTVAGQNAPIAYAGAAPGSIAGLMQVNFQVPPLTIQTFASGAVSVPLMLQVGPFPAQSGITMYVALQ